MTAVDSVSAGVGDAVSPLETVPCCGVQNPLSALSNFCRTSIIPRAVDI